MRFLKTLSIVVFSTISIYTNAQTASLRGFVYDKANGEAVLFTPVQLKGTSIGVNTDVNGYYSIVKVAPGSYTLLVSAIGYEPLEVPVTVVANDIITKKLFLIKKNIELSTVEVSAEKQEAKTAVRIGVTKITTKELKQVPTVGGEADIAQYLQVLPGVVSTGDQGGQLYIRGGEPIQNLVMIDGMPIYNPFHSIGLFSVFDTEILKNADVYTAGFNAEYGGRISSVIDIKTRDGNKKRLAGRISTSPFMSKLLLEGPLVKESEEGGGSSSFLISAKTSYLKQTGPIFYSYVPKYTGAGDTKNPIPYNFTDLYGKLSFSSSNGSKLSLFGFNFTDSALFRGISNIGWTATGGGANFVVIPGNSPMLMDGIVAYSKYQISQQDASNLPRSSGISGFNLGLNFTYFLQKDEIKYGASLQAYSTNYGFFTPLGVEQKIEESTAEAVAFFKYKKILGPVIIEPGIHLRYYVNLDEPVAEPRLGMKWNVNNSFRLKAAAGLYSQNLIGTGYDRHDVVVLFNGFLTGPENLPPTFNGQDKTNSRLQKARHYVVGFEYDLNNYFTANVEAYYKDFYQLTNLNHEKLYPTDYDYAYEQGQARGIDFQLKYEYKRLNLSAIYSLGFVNRQYEATTSTSTTPTLVDYTPVFDRRHNINITGSYLFGKGYKWQFDMRYNFGSGFPFTQTAGFGPNLNFNDNPNTNYATANSTLNTIYASLNGGRLSYYERLDASIKRTFDLGRHTSLEAIGSVTNLLNRANIFYVDRITGVHVYQLPVLPSLGLALIF